MKRNTALRTMSASLAAVCLLSAASCSLPGQGSGSGSSKGEKPKQSASEVIKHSYRAEQVGGMPSVDYVNSMTRLGDTDSVLVVGSDYEGVTHMFITDTDFTDFSEVKPDIEIGENAQLYCNVNAALDGTIFDVATVTDYGDMKLPDWDDPDFDYDTFDWDAFNDAATTTTYIYTFDSQGNELTHAEVDMTQFTDGTEDDMVTPYLGSVTPIDSERALAYVGGEHELYYILKSDGTFGNQVSFPDDLWLGQICATPDGNIAFSSWSSDNACIGTIDTDTLKVSQEDIVLKDFGNEGISVLVSGDENFAYYASTYRGLFGIKDDGSSEEITTWIDSDLNGDYVRGMMCLGSNEFAIFIYDYTDPSANGFYRISERDASELADKTLITLAVVYSDNNLMTEVNSFNRTSDKYRIKVNDYSQYYDWDEDSEKYLNTPAKQFKLDIIAGKTPDMIYFDGSGVTKGLTNKGAFVDLYEYLDKDGSISKEDLMPPLLKACEEDGKLYALAPNCSMSTAAVKKKYTDKENWTIDDLIETYNKLPEGTKLTQWINSKMAAFEYLTGNMNFVDYKTGKTSYDSEEFIKILEFANRFPDEEEEPDWKNMTEDEQNAYYEEHENAIRLDKALVSDINFYDLRNFNREKLVTFGEDITIVGLPSTDGCGMVVNQNARFSILSDSPNKDECWNFISRFFTEDYQKKDTWSIPALKSVFEDRLKEAMEDPYWTDEKGEKHTYPNEATINGENVTIPNLSEDDAAFLRDLIYNAKVHGMQMWDTDVNEIVEEEVAAYFAGEKTAEQTAEIIQNRVSILVSEQS
ncbi:MAG: extracellular solute-binding protein [Ruminococcus sp.]|nr:extracellular solute-binding protein [Ruminococcus sp.]